MRVFSYPAAYERFVESSLKVLLAEIGRDAASRNDADPYMRRFATVPDRFVDGDVEGRVAMVTGIPDGLNETSAVTELLAAAAPARKTA